jgi:hypothetical protein
VNGLYDELMRLHRIVSKCKKTEEREREREDGNILYKTNLENQNGVTY